MIPNIKGFFKKYRKLIEKGSSGLDSFLDLFENSEGPEEVKNRIEKFAIDELSKKIVIFIDNIDRLDGAESQLVFKLVRLCSNFKNTIFVLSLDPGIVEGRGLERDYLEKIIQKPINLPAIEKLYIDAFFELSLSGEIAEEYIYSIFSKEDNHSAKDDLMFRTGIKNYRFKDGILENNFESIQDMKSRERAIFLWQTSKDCLFKKLGLSDELINRDYKDFPIFYKKNIRPYLTTLRKAKRYFNGIASTLPVIYNEIHLLDFMGIEILRIFFPSLYSDVWENPWAYIPVEWGFDGIVNDSPFNYSNKDKKYEIIKNHVDEQLKKIEEEVNKNIILDILKELFFVEVKNAYSVGKGVSHDNMAQEYRSRRRITHPQCFNKYFSFQTPKTDLTDEFVINLIQAWEKEPTRNTANLVMIQFQKMKSLDRLSDLFERLALHSNKINMKLSIELILVISKYSINLTKKDHGSIWSSEFDKADYLLIRLLNDRVDKQYIESTLKDVVLESSDLYFLLTVIDDLSKPHEIGLSNIAESINVNEMIQMTKMRFRKFFIEENNNIFESYPGRSGNIIFWYWAKHWEPNYKENKIKGEAIEYLMHIFNSEPKYIVNFLENNMQKGLRRDGVSFNFDQISELIELKDLVSICEKCLALGIGDDIINQFKNDAKKWQEAKNPK